MSAALLEDLAALSSHTEVPAFVDGVLSLLASSLGAGTVYMSLGPSIQRPTWRHCLPEEQLDDVLARVSTGAMAEAIGTGEVVVTTSAHHDPRFASRQSVRRNRIEAVLCAPVGDPIRGVLYVQNRLAGGPFNDEEEALFRRAAALIGPLSQRLVRESQLDAPDATERVRSSLRLRGIVGRSAAIAGVLDELAACARTRAPVLLTGETGTGKSLLARALHDNSGRTGPFVSVECTQLREDRTVADLFGARAGAYTGIQRDRPGFVEAARRGTLFLDEIGELPGEVQGQLLRFLQDGTYRWLGDTQARNADVRVVAATHVDLAKAVETGTFRADLHYRLAVFPVSVPALRDRLEDLPLLAHAFVERAASEFDVAALPLATSALVALESRTWAGNLRELDNVLRRALLLANHARAGALQATHLHRGPDAPPTEPHPASLGDAVTAFKRRYVLRALDAEQGNKSRAAKRLGIGRSSLYELLDALDDPDH